MPSPHRSATLKQHTTTALWMPFVFALYVFMGGRSPTSGFDYARPIAARRRRHPFVEDDAWHIADPCVPGLTLCEQRITPKANVVTRDEMRKDPGSACWTCQGSFDGTLA